MGRRSLTGMMVAILSAALLWSVAGVAVAADGGWTQQAKLTVYGTVSIDGDTAIVGAPPRAYIFKRAGVVWKQQAELTAAESGFGRSVSIDGDTAVVGTSSNAAYVFTHSRGVWTQQAKLTASQYSFGYPVSISGDTVVVSDLMGWQEIGGAHYGTTYVFRRSGGVWTQEAELLVGTDRDAFYGWAVSIDGDTAVVGAPWDYEGWGSVTIFRRGDGNWTSQDGLAAFDTYFEGFFGWSVSLSGNTVIVGVPYDESDNDWWETDNSGSAYIYTTAGGAGWRKQAKLTASDAAPNVQFGRSVAIDGDTAIVGAHVFVSEDWTVVELASFTATAGERDVTLAWETGAEIDDAGFHVYRAMSPGGEYPRVNELMIAAKADHGSGASYVFTDIPGKGTFYYKLEDVDTHGVRTLHGPVQVTVGLEEFGGSNRLYLPALSQN